MSVTENKKSILIVDDDDDLRETISDLMDIEGWEVTACNNADKAIETLKQKKFSLILSDYRMPGKSGLDLLKWCLEQPIDSVFIFMSGYADIKNPQDAIAEGAHGYISKPFSISALKDYLNDFDLNNDKNKKSQDKDSFLPIPQKSVIADCELPFSIYIKLDDHYVRIVHRGETLPSERQLNYKNKGVKTFYLSESDYVIYLEFSTAMIKGQSADSHVPAKDKLDFAAQIGSTIYDQIKKDGVKLETLTAANEITQESMNILLQDEQVYNLLTDVIDENNYLFSHSMAVSMVALMIANEMGIEDEESQFVISTAAMMHDISKKDWPEDLILGEVKLLTALQKQMQENHPKESAKLLRACPQLPKEIAIAVEQHHENCLGTGFPNALKEKEIHPVAKIINLSDYFLIQLATAKKHNMTKFWVFCSLANDSKKFDIDMLEGLMSAFDYLPKKFGLSGKKAS